MAVIALWEFDDGTGTGRNPADAEANSGTQGGEYVNNPSPHTREMQLQDGRIVNLPSKDAAQAEGASIRLEFSQEDGAEDATLVSRDFDDGGYFAVTTTSGGRVEVSQETDGEAHFFATPDGFVGAGDDVRITFSWGEGAAFTAENLTSGATHSQPVPADLTMDPGLDAPWTFGVPEQSSGQTEDEDGPGSDELGSVDDAAPDMDFGTRDDAAPDEDPASDAALPEEPAPNDDIARDDPGPGEALADGNWEGSDVDSGDGDGPEDGLTDEDGADEDHTEEGNTDEDRAEEDHTEEGNTDEIRAGEDHTDEDRAGADAAGGTETHTVTLTFEGSTAGFGNTLGHYFIDPETGQISGVGIAFEDARAEFGGGDLIPGSSQTRFDVPPGVQVGTFLIADGANVNDFGALGSGEFMFLNSEGDPATLADPTPQLVHVAPDGTQTPLNGNIWHSAGFGEGTGLHTDDAVHLQGVAENGDGTWTFGFEDLHASVWDADFTDVVFTVDLGDSGATFLNPDYDAQAGLPGEAADPGFGDEDDAEPDGEDVAGIAPDDEGVSGVGLDADANDDDDGGVGGDEGVNPGGAEDEGSGSDGDEESPPEAQGSEGQFNDPDVTSGGTLTVGASALAASSDKEKIVPCFTPGTLIDTDEGRIPVEELFAGDRVLTRDRGYRRLAWVGHKVVTPELLAERPEFAPVRIARGALGDSLPEREMLVSPQHRMLIAGARSELLFGESEVLVPALHLVGQPGIVRAHDVAVTYIHIMCDRHEIVRADGCWSESFQPGDLSLAGLDEDQRSELLALFPELSQGAGRRAYAAARMTLKAHEARVLIGV